jgi:carbamoyltransferase
MKAGMPNYHLGINLGHDRAAALVRDGEIIVAIHQERLDRRKHSVGVLHQSVNDLSQVQPPDEAIRYCLEYSGITLSDVLSITANMPGIDYGPEILRRKLTPELADRVLRIPSHHLAHAYSAYWPSGFDEALVLVVDASGTTTPDRQTESYTLYEGRDNGLAELDSHKVPAHLAALSTLGFVYEYITRKAGFTTEIGSAISIPEAGKLMGLASYGNLQHNWQRWFELNENRDEIGISAYDIFLEVAALEKRYDDKKGKPYLRAYLVDLAYKVQSELEEALLHIVANAVRKTGLRKLCMAGGVALNSVANYRLFRDLALDDIFIFPSAGDGGIAAGCAMWAYATQEKNCRRPRLRRAALGKRYNAHEINKALNKFSDRIMAEELSADQIITRTGEALVNGHIVARFDSRSEYGPRALGHRSIMADPIFSQMKDVVNARVKFREAFRPFAPVIPEESISEVFEQQVASPFMLLVSPIKQEYRTKIPAVTHYDGTGRVQTVTEVDNRFFYRVCHLLPKLRGGPPVLLNTSFNVAGQPIVETPEEAIQTFLTTDIDYLCLEDLWLSKRDVPVQTYEEHLRQVNDNILPKGLPPGEPSVIDLMRQLDRALFWGEFEGCIWSLAQLRTLSTQGGRFKETSVLCADNPFGRPFKTQLSSDAVLLLDPLGKSVLKDFQGFKQPAEYSFEEVKLLMGVLADTPTQLDKLRVEQQFTTREWDERINWAVQQLTAYRLQPGAWFLQSPSADAPLPNHDSLIVKAAVVSS